MPKVCFCITHPPGTQANEIVDIASVTAVFDLDITLMFMGDGVWQLFDSTDQPSDKNTTNYLSALPTYGVSEFLVDSESLVERNLLERLDNGRANEANSSFLEHVVIQSSSELRTLLQEFEMVISG